MSQAYWLSRRNAAVAAAHSATCTEACLASFHDAGIFSVLARAAQVASADLSPE